jgi:hypothetical protein
MQSEVSELCRNLQVYQINSPNLISQPDQALRCGFAFAGPTTIQGICLRLPGPTPDGPPRWAGSEINGVACRFMTHPTTLCARCMSQGEFVTGRARGGRRATVRSSCLTALATRLPIWRRWCEWWRCSFAQHRSSRVRQRSGFALTRRRMGGCKF